MNAQPELDFSGPALRDAAARRTDPTTSHEAAASIEGTEATRLQGIVLDALKHNPMGLTNHGLVRVTGLAWNTVSPRIRPLVRKGLVCDTGRREREAAGRRCIVWALTEGEL